MKRLLTVIMFTAISSNLMAYRLNTVAQKGARWKNLPISMNVNPSDSGLDENETADTIRKSMTTWNSALGRTVLEVSNANSSIHSSRIMEANGENSIGFSNNFRFDSNGFDPDVVVAVGGQYKDDNNGMTDGFILFNSESVAWTTDNSNMSRGISYTDDLQTVATHELGHVIGLGHSENVNAIMSTERLAPVMRELHSDDIDGAQYLLAASADGSGKSLNTGGCGYIADINSGSNSGNGNNLPILPMALMLLPILTLSAIKVKIFSVGYFKLTI